MFSHNNQRKRSQLLIGMLALLGLAVLLNCIPAHVPVARADSFNAGESSLWQDFFCIGDEICGVGDFDADGQDDIIRFVRSSDEDQLGNVYVALSDGTDFIATGNRWQDYFCIGDEICGVGDFDADGQDDIITFVRSTQTDGQEGDVYVALSTGSAFVGAGNQWAEFFCVEEEVCGVGDFNGDGADDVIAFVRSSQDDDEDDAEGDVYVALAEEGKFGERETWDDFFCVDEEICKVGDVNGDGRDDIITFLRDTQLDDERGDVYVALSTGSGFAESKVWHDFFCDADQVCDVGDFDGDGRDDIVAFDQARGYVYVALADEDEEEFQGTRLWHDLFCIDDEVCGTGDFDGDDRDDIVAFLRDTQMDEERGNVYVARSTEEDLERDLNERLYLPLVVR
jgi:hypothetical protein